MLSIDATGDNQSEPVAVQLVDFITCGTCASRVPVAFSVTRKNATSFRLTVADSVDGHTLGLELTGSTSTRVAVRHCPHK